MVSGVKLALVCLKNAVCLSQSLMQIWSMYAASIL